MKLDEKDGRTCPECGQWRQEYDCYEDGYCLSCAAKYGQVKAELLKWQRIRKPTHGTCCTCQRCGLDHDTCRCDLDEVIDELEQLKLQIQR